MKAAKDGADDKTPTFSQAVKQVCTAHPASIHEKFTENMHDWELEWDSFRWYATET